MGFRRRSAVGGPCLTGPMTEAANHDSGLDDLSPDALLDALADADRRARQADLDKLLIAHQWAVLHPATPESGVVHLGRRGAAGRRVPGRRGLPAGRRLRPRTPRRHPRRLTRHRDAADRRRPRPAAPAPADLGAGRVAGGAGVEGPPGRPAHPHPAPGGRRVGRREDRAPAAPLRRPAAGHRPRRGDRPLRPRPARRPRVPGEEADLGRGPAHAQRVGVRRHQRAPHHRRHPAPHRPLPTDLPRRGGRGQGRRRQPAGRPQGPGAGHPVHRWSRRIDRWSRQRAQRPIVETRTRRRCSTCTST